MKYEPMDLYDFIIEESTIECSQCRKIRGTFGIDAEDRFFEEGWRATKSGNVYCPECASKKLKPKKKIK